MGMEEEQTMVWRGGSYAGPRDSQLLVCCSVAGRQAQRLFTLADDDLEE